MLKWLVALAAIWVVWKVLGRPKRATLPNDQARARAVLGVSAGADAETIRAAHRRLVERAHPDRGGSTELTRELNAARDLLLRARA